MIRYPKYIDSGSLRWLILVILACILISDVLDALMIRMLQPSPSWVVKIFGIMMQVLCIVPVIYYYLKRSMVDYTAKIRHTEAVLQENRKVLSKSLENNGALMRVIAERNQMKKELQESEERWQYSLEGAGDGVWDWNAKTNEVFYSHQWKAMFGYADDEIGNTLDEWSNRLHPDDKENVYKELTRHLQKEIPDYRSEHRVRCKDGTYKWILDRGKVFDWSSDGKPLRVIGTHKDISDRKRAEDILRESEKRLREVLEKLSDVSYKRNLNLNAYEYLSPVFARVTGYSTDEIMDLSYTAMLQMVHPDDRAKKESIISESMSSTDGSVFQMEYRFKHKDGYYRWFHEQFTVICNENGQPVARIGSIRDLTERKTEEIIRGRTTTQSYTAIEQIDTLSGILPVCVNCNKISKGMGY